jgi:hypothetical protein
MAYTVYLTVSVLKVARRLRSPDILEQLGYLFIYRGLPSFIRSDNGPEFTAKAVRSWLERLGVQTLFIEPAVHGRMDTMNRLMESLETNY